MKKLSITVRFGLMGGALLWLISGVLAFGQLPTGTIAGVVTDPTGSVIPNAAVTVTHTDTGATRTFTTAGDGSYRFADLPVGNYRVQVVHQDFSTEQTTTVLTVGEEKVLRFKLTVGTISEKVEVSASAPLVDTTGIQLGNLVNEQKLAQLPLNGRNFIDLTLLQPGITVQTMENPGGGITGTIYSSNGAPTRSNNVMIDGTPMQNMTGLNAASEGGTTLGMGGIKEFQVITDLFSAEYGLSMGSQTTIVSKSGTNNLHGDVFEYLRNSALDARNYFDELSILPPTVPEGGKRIAPFRRNQFGGSLGGPIKENKTFYFLNYEGLREVLGDPNYVGLLTVPSAGCHPPGASAANDFGAGSMIWNGIGPPPPGAVGPCPQMTPAPPPVNVTELIPTMAPLLNLYPLPDLNNNPNGNYAYASFQNTREDYGNVRFDHTFSAADSFFGRYTIDDSLQNRPLSYPQFHDSWPSLAQFLTLSENHIFSPALLNSARVFFARTAAEDISTSTPLLVSGPTYGNISEIPGQETGDLVMSGLTTFGGDVAPQHNIQNLIGLGDDWFWTKGKHNLKYGLLLIHWEDGTTVHLLPGSFNIFPNFSEFISGIIVSSTFSAAPEAESRNFTFGTYGFYAQDDYRVLSRVTLNLGFRYEFATVPWDHDGNNYAYRDLATDSSSEVTKGPIWQNASLKNLSPRVGLAWDIFGNGKTAVRGGYGIYYDVGNIGAEAGNNALGTYPAMPTSIYLCQLSIPLNTNGCPAPPPAPPGTLITPGFVVPSTQNYYAKQPYMDQYSVGVEQQLPAGIALSVVYVGSRGIHLWSVREGNPVVPIAGTDAHGNALPANELTSGKDANPVFNTNLSIFSCPLGNSCRVNPNMAGVTFYTTNGDSWYNSLQVGVTKHLTKGLQFQSSYTWSRLLDDAQGLLPHNTDGSDFPLNPFDVKADRGLTAFDLKSNWRFNLLYSLPGPQGGSLGAKIFRGWRVANIVAAQTGFPFTPMLGTGFNNSNSELGVGDTGGLANERVSYVTQANIGAITNSSCTPPWVPPGLMVYNPTNHAWCNPNAVVYNPKTVITGNPHQWFNPNMFTVAPPGQFGNVPRGALYGPGLFDWDFSMSKDTSLGEAGKLEFRADFFNILNHANFGFPSVWNSNYGVFNTAGTISSPPPVFPATTLPASVMNETAGEISNTADYSREIQFSLRFEF